MPSAPPPPPPGPAVSAQPGPVSSAAHLPSKTPAQAQFPFYTTGASLADATFEFPESTDKSGSIPLKVIVRQFLGSPHVKSVLPQQLNFVLGRLRCLRYTIAKYNEGVVSQSSVFLQYWRRRTIDLLSGFGFQVTDPKQPVSIVGLDELIQKIEEFYQDEIKTARELISSGMIVFDALTELYRPDIPIQGKMSLGGAPGVFMVVDSFYEERKSLVGMEKSFHWTMEYVATMGDHFSVVRFTEVLSGWTGVRARVLSEMTYTPLTDPEQLKAVKARGNKYTEYGVGGSRFLAYSPNTFFIHGSTSGSSMAKSGSNLLTSGGRLMVDAARGAMLGHHASQGMDEPTLAMTQLAGRYRRWKNSQTGSGAAQDSLFLWESVPDELKIYCWPALVGFSFSAKAWGHVLVSGLEDIQFQDKAFDQLVLAEERKQLIRALVKFGGDPNFDDIVCGKRGGSIFLLHGPPGVGKTLTAEAIAEVLHRPLYYVTMGELGLTPDELEKRLSDVLELCAGWNALALFDEADVFLEQRNSADVTRNAMVCVMLRLLEYHPGILFLTTNRVQKFDPAFESRVTVALRYDNLSSSARVQVWKNLMQRVTIPVASNVDYSKLGKHVLNGRQIKNAVRLAVALARERQSPVTQQILETTLQITSIGRQEMKEDNSWKE